MTFVITFFRAEASVWAVQECRLVGRADLRNLK
jgi:hypothetical protein